MFNYYLMNIYLGTYIKKNISKNNYHKELVLRILIIIY